MTRLSKKYAKRKEREFSFIRDAWRRFKRNRTAVFGLFLIFLLIFVAVFAGVITKHSPYTSVPASANQTPNANHWFGADHMGRDLFARCIYGARWSLPIGLVSMVLALLGGGMLGLVAAFFGKRTDEVIMRIADVFQAIPGVLMAITVVATLGAGTPQLLIAIFISFVPTMSRIVRAAVLTVRGNEYIQAAICVGSRNMHLMLRHMLPNAVGHIIIFAVFTISAGINLVTTLSYIGLGIQPPAPEWGSLLASGRHFISVFPHMVIFPGAMIMVTILAFNLFGDGLRDALDPRLK